ncbi:hypothetical protein FOL47_007404 [Perkinsus chesapeaki]|uniref:Uncharacterized protein n=1 Tax=Perkinsus chesapeaki TaxID=330153 RepID=A0A7J6LKN4_PERCH|nr:hypothetical protein FOL47_007404 [Perkinsus chesapeaki]
MSSSEQNIDEDAFRVEDFVSAQAAVGLIPKDVAAYIKRSEKEAVKLREANRSLEATNAKLINKLRVAHLRSTETKHMKHVDAAARTIMQLKKLLREEQAKREKQEAYVRRLERKLLEQSTKGFSRERGRVDGVDSRAIIRAAADELGVRSNEISTLDVRSGLSSELCDEDFGAFTGVQHKQESPKPAKTLLPNERAPKSSPSMVLAKWEKVQEERSQKLKTARSTTPRQSGRHSSATDSEDHCEISDIEFVTDMVAKEHGLDD